MTPQQTLFAEEPDMWLKLLSGQWKIYFPRSRMNFHAHSELTQKDRFTFNINILPNVALLFMFN